jgi:hypothetical protein
MHGKLIALGKLKLASRLRCGKNPLVGEKGYQRRFREYNKSLQGKPIAEPNGGRNVAWSALNSGIQGSVKNSGQYKYSSSSLIVNFLHGH